MAADLPFTFLFAFDHESVTERKNPWGVLEAYRRAFPVPDQSTRLILKSISGDLHPDDHERLLFSVDRPDIEVRDGYLATADQHALMRSCDAYVSLHRAEGWGLTLIEAMAAGRPVIATGYSGNVDFMSPNNSWLIPFKLVPIPDSAGPYVGCGRWAEPDLNAAAQAMREVRTDPILARRKGQQAAADMGARAASSIGPDTIRARLRALRALRGAAPPAAAYPAASVAGARLADAPILHRHPSATPTGPLSSTTPQDTQETPMPADDTPSGHPPPFSHPGVGPVHLPVPPPLPDLPPGVRSAPRRAIVEAMQPFLEHQRTADTQRDVAVAHAIGETRLAVQALASEQVRLAQDVVTFSDMASKTLAHLEALQAAHDALAAQRADADAELAARLRREVEDLRADLEVLRRRTVP